LYLNECLLSIKNQTYDNIEVIIIDDGSTDFSIKVAKTFEHYPGFKIVKREHFGLTKTLNYALSRCRGNYVAFVGADDIIDPTYIDMLLQSLKAKKGDYSMTSVREMNTNKIKVPPLNPKIEGIIQTNQLFGCFLIKRQIIKEIGFDESPWNYAEDWDFWLTALHLGIRGSIVHEPLYIQRVRENSRSDFSFLQKIQMNIFLATKYPLAFIKYRLKALPQKILKRLYMRIRLFTNSVKKKKVRDVCK
jgi:glycosyltransferase involved in cell wall biosynthesis